MALRMRAILFSISALRARRDRRCSHRSFVFVGTLGRRHDATSFVNALSTRTPKRLLTGVKTQCSQIVSIVLIFIIISLSCYRSITINFIVYIDHGSRNYPGNFETHFLTSISTNYIQDKSIPVS